MASRELTSALESTTLTSLNAINNGPATSFLPPSKRRKFLHTEDAELPSAQTTFSVKGHASSLSDNDFILSPIEVLPRSALPFSWLDMSTAMQSSNVFASNDEGLERMFISGCENEMAFIQEPKVLTTRLLSNSAIYVVERVKKGIFAMTKLQSSIGDGDIMVTAKAAAAGTQRPNFWNSSRALHIANDDSNSWDWEVAARLPDDLICFESFPKHSKLDVSVVFEDYDQTDSNTSNRCEPSIESQVSIGDTFMALDEIANPGIQMHIRTPPTDGAQISMLEPEHSTQENTTITPDTMMENLRTQYLEALYISKTSVAYFAKGPLTRCRNAFSQANLEVEHPCLSTQYRESILSVKKMDSKYREALPTILRNMTLLLSDDERPKKRKSKKKKKLGKNGLYPGEDEFLQKYWRSRQIFKNREGEQESKEEEIRRHISELRLRETQLQILLILETIHLDNSSSASTIKDGKGQITDGSNTKRSKPMKEEDLNLLLELLIDRLCIWHTVSAGEGIIADSVKETTDRHLSGKKIESDALRDFCNEVIIPFYASRLPDQCKIVKKKLGGASEPSPSRPAVPPKLKSSLSSSSKASSNANDGKKAQLQHLRPRRTLQRVLTDEQTADSQRTRHPSLMRSSTTPALQEIKRESVEPALPSLNGSVRGGIQAPRRVDKREVDLNAVAKQHEAKIKKMNTLMEQKRELDAAINAMRKPNRELVAKEVADQAERRTTSSRKPKNPVRNPLGQGVQVTATPRGSRKKDINADRSHIPMRHFMPRASAEKKTANAVRVSPETEGDITVIPGSTIRPNLLSSTTKSKRKFDGIAETPSRRDMKRSDSQDTTDKTPLGTPVSSTMAIPCSRALFKVPTLPAIPPRSTDEGPERSNTSAEDPLGEELQDTGAGYRDIGMQRSRDQTPPEITISSAAIQTPPARGQPIFSQQVSATKAVPFSSPGPVLETPIRVRGVGSLSAELGQTVQTTPVKSIYEELGWDNEDDELAF